MNAVGRYEIIAPISSGSAGVVQRARDTLHGREVALKVPRQGAAISDPVRQRFLREGRICARLRHPGIVTVHDFGEADGVPYIAMELLEGADLGAYIEEKRRLPAARSLDLFAQVCDALAHVHANQVVHRNVNPRSIFVQGERQAKILDFGLAYLESAHLTVAGKVIGTPNYMAPEQIHGKPCDARSDLFSAAIVFFEWIAGVHPFQSSFIPRRIAEEDPDSIAAHDPALPAALEVVFRKALAKAPEGRYQTGEQLAAAIRAVLAGPAAAQPARPVDEPATDAAMSQFLSLSAACNECFARKDLPSARDAVASMRRLGETDTRFADAVSDYQRRLDQETAAAAPAIDAARLAAMSLEKTTILKAPQEIAEEPPPEIVAPAASPPALQESRSWWKPAIVVALLAAAGFGYRMWRPVPSEPAVGSAVAAAPAHLFAAPSESGLADSILETGARVDILALPDRGWVRVRPARGGPGFVATDTLADWSTLELLRATRPSDSADPSARKKYTDSLLRYLVRQSGAEAREVRLEIVREQVAGLRATAWATSGDCEASADRAGQLLRAAGGDPQLETQIGLARRQCASPPRK